MKKIFLLAVIVALAGCAGGPRGHQRNMAKNAGLWGAIGALTGAGIAVATHGIVRDGAIWGAIAGAYLGAGNTPEEPSPAITGYCSQFKTAGERRACERGAAERARALQRARERAAYRYGLGDP